MAASSLHNGWRYDPANTRLDIYYRGTRTGHANATGWTTVGTLTSGGAFTVTTGGATITAGGLTVTAGGGTITAGDFTVTAGDVIGTSGNVFLANPGTFASTQPVGAVVMGGSSLNGTAPAGAITTAAGIFASDTVVRKIIADGTASNVET